MNSLEILLTLVFVVILYMVVCKELTSEMVATAAALWFVVFWIGFDNIGAWSSSSVNIALENCGLSPHKKKYKTQNNIKTWSNMSKNIVNKNIVKMNKTDQEIKETLDKTMESVRLNNQATADKRPMPLVYSEENYKYNLFDEIGSLGDNLLAHKMKQISNKNREAIDNFSRTYSKYSNINYFEQELNDAANSRWWDNPELEKHF